ncbi:MAG TPA: hypothetical protein VK149_00725 [Sideroxyarcus sp.]|nr:hypothetical protein [Sideroxyarcus sp.]
MFKTSFGAFDGDSWEALCQQVFKKKFADEGYHSIPASPGDFGLEGFTLLTGKGFQCYCPDKHYTQQELYENQRDKITKDLGKLRKNETELARRLGTTKLNHWYFVTPEINKNELLAHARAKEAEVRGWNLSILSQDFHVHLHDAEHYLVEINEILSAAGVALDFGTSPPALPALTEQPEVYEDNVLRKTQARLKAKQTSPKYNSLVNKISQQTLEDFLEADAGFRRIQETAPTLSFKLLRLINEFEKFVAESSATWEGTAEELTTMVRDRLTQRIVNDLSPQFNETSASQVSRHMVARWLAICELDYD